MESNLIKSISALDVPLSQKLGLIRKSAPLASGTSQLRAWGQRCLALSGEALDRWVVRAWWGLSAGEVVREHLYDEQLRPAVLELIDPPDWTAVDEARQHGGVILVAAHIGPPKTAMNYLIDRNLPLLIWTNTQDMPEWLPLKTGAKFLDPLFAEDRAALLVRTALHLRTGGLLFGAPDWASGARPVILNRLGVDWAFSLGIPTLVRQLRVPSFLVMALWRGDRIQMVCTPIHPPDFSIDKDTWNRLWVEQYWGEIEPIVTSSPENLRFLRSVEGGALCREMGL
jgi:hypothetical protein